MNIQIRTEKGSYNEARKKFQKIDIELNDEQKHGIKNNRIVVLKPVATKKYVVIVLHTEQQCKRKSKCNEALQRYHQSLKVFGTSRETTNNVTENAKTEPLKPSMRDTPPPRHRNSFSTQKPAFSATVQITSFLRL